MARASGRLLGRGVHRRGAECPTGAPRGEMPRPRPPENRLAPPLLSTNQIPPAQAVDLEVLRAKVREATGCLPSWSKGRNAP
jgi:hypothetical protein